MRSSFEKKRGSAHRRCSAQKGEAMKRKQIISALILASLLALTACGKAIDTTDAESPAATEADTDQGVSSITDGESEEMKEETMIYAYIGENVLEIAPADNSSAQAFIELLSEGDLTVEMQDYGSFEKVGSLGTTLPTNDEHIRTEPGDVILYQGSSITIYYDTNTWNFTRLGKVQDLSKTQLKEILGAGDASVTFSLTQR